MDNKPLLIDPQRPQWLAVVFVGALAAWLAVPALPPEPDTSPIPSSAAPVPAGGSGSQYPAPQVDASAPATEPPPTF